MLRHPLIVHPDCPGSVVTSVEVMLERPSVDRLKLAYVVYGEIHDLVFPAAAAPLRTDGLWETTCFEAFLSVEGAVSYREFNFSPSGRWAAYAFSTHRDPQRRDSYLAAPPQILIWEMTENRLEVRVDLHVDLPPSHGRLNLAAVVDEGGGTKSYWALAHPKGDPDFHDRACFTLELPPPAQP